MTRDHTSVEVADIPLCDFCLLRTTHDSTYNPRQATVDGATKDGPWAYMCDPHFRVHGVGLGLGRGQRLILRNS